MKNSRTWHLHIEGQVQGVGFRPFVYRLARKYHLCGWVNNSSDGIHIEFNADEVTSKLFYDQVILQAPHLARITAHCLTSKPLFVYHDFTIQHSDTLSSSSLQIAPDFGICVACREEIRDKFNRRYHYAFTTCTACGPRFSIMKQLPYDRENTSMENFEMCANCKNEYNDPTNRRHFSQTNSCSECPVVMTLVDNQNQIIDKDQEEIIHTVCSLWEGGKIIALKGVGGYMITCDASNAAAIREMRKRKHRPTKPFALMFPDLHSIEKEVVLHPFAITALTSEVAPIVLLPVQKNSITTIAKNDIAPGLSKLGVMLPYAPLFQVLLQQFSKPIVATSANISHAPIVFIDDTQQNGLHALADYTLFHDRGIVASQDDSVITYTRHEKKRIVIRRGRGLAPLYSNPMFSLPKMTVVAMGALMKSSFSLLHRDQIHVSQFLGDMNNYDAQIHFDQMLHHYVDMFQAQPEVILVDLHPDFFTTQKGEQMSKIWNCPLVRVQHHEAHFASVLGEHQLLVIEEPVLGVIWDGTGLGNDKQIWGGEFFIFHNQKLSRIAHFENFNHMLGDKMSMEPRLSAFSLCHDLPEAQSLLEVKFTPTEWKNYQKILSDNQLKTSSAGRIFDAVASLLGLADYIHYEGEGAMLVEEQAASFFKKDFNIPVSWMSEMDQETALSAQQLLKEMIGKIKEGIDTPEIAAWFHVRLVLMIQSVAVHQGVHKICCSGGVFQNGLLVDLVIRIMGHQFQLYFNSQLAPNDENISFGQLIWFSMMKKKASIN